MAEVGENGCSKAERLPKSSSSFRATPHTIVTIDFGTTHCSLSYLYGVNKHPNPLEIEPVLLSLDQQGRKRVPSCILFDEQGKGKSFGYQARDEYATMGKRARTSHAYFEHIKKELKREKVSYLNCTRLMPCQCLALRPGYNMTTVQLGLSIMQMLYY